MMVRRWLRRWLGVDDAADIGAHLSGRVFAVEREREHLRKVVSDALAVV